MNKTRAQILPRVLRNLVVTVTTMPYFIGYNTTQKATVRLHLWPLSGYRRVYEPNVA